MSNQCPPSNNDSHPSDCQILEAFRARSHERAHGRDNAQMRLLLAKAEPIKLLLLDVDGVLTDGTLIYTESGEEAKAFNTQDGLGVRLAQKAGIDVGLITARSSTLVNRRATELGFQYIQQGVTRKLDAFKDILKTSGLKPYQICYMGDDWIDLALLTRIGFAACPANSVPEVKEICHLVTSRSGGHGAVREVCDILIKAKGAQDKLLQQYLG